MIHVGKLIGESLQRSRKLVPVNVRRRNVALESRQDLTIQADHAQDQGSSPPQVRGRSESRTHCRRDRRVEGSGHQVSVAPAKWASAGRCSELDDAQLWPLGLPLRDHVGDHVDGDIWKVRTKLENRIARVWFVVDGAVMVLLHGFIKEDQKTPARPGPCKRSIENDRARK